MPNQGTILVVDDTPATLKLVRAMLEAEAYGVLTAENGSQALCLVAENAPDLILLDIRLPDMDGYEVCRKLKGQAQSSAIPVIIFSAMTQTNERVAAFEAGAIDFVSKPFEREELLVRVRVHLELSRMRRELATMVAERTRKLNESEERYRISIQSIKDYAILILDADGTVLSWNEAAERIKGYKPEEIIGKHFSQFYPPEDRGLGRPAAVLKEAREKGSYQEEGWRVRKDGSRFMADVVVSAVHDASGMLTGFVKVTRDITTRKADELQLRKLLRAVEQSQASIVITDLKGDIEYVNPQFTRITGYAFKEVIGQNPRILKSGHTSDKEYQRMWTSLVAGSAWRGEFLNRRKDGSEYWEDAAISAVTNEHGVVTNYVAVKEDITERKQVELALQRKSRMLAVLSETNAAIVHTQDCQSLFDKICRSALELGGFVLSWVGIVDEADLRVVPVAVAGEAMEYVRGITIHCRDDLPSGRGPTGTSIRENRYVVTTDFAQDGTTRPWQEAAQRYGIRSSLSLPIKGNGMRGALMLYATEPGYFDREVIQLLLEVAENMSFALKKIREAKERAEAIAKLRLHAAVFQESAEGMIITDDHSHIVMVNHAFSEITGYTEDDVLGKTPRILQSGKHDWAFYARMWEVLQQTDTWQGEIWNRRKDGEVYPEWVVINAVRDEAGKVANYFAVFSDLSQKKTLDELNRLKHYDPLTELPNRLLMEDRVSEAIIHARQYQRHVALLFIDLENFHMVNDLLGHVAGDWVLKTLADRLVSVVGGAGTVSRLSADTYMVALPDLNQIDEINPYAERILEAISAPFYADGKDVNLFGRIGIAVYPADGDDFATLMQKADAALLYAKREGRNAYRFFANDMNVRAHKVFEIGSVLRSAIEKNWLWLHYQPQLSVSSGKIIGVEALVRINHPEKGMIPPGDFIPIAEETGLILDIGKWVLTEACHQMKRWQAAGMEGVVVAINVSPLQLHQAGLADMVETVLHEAGLEPQFLELEITESALMRNVDANIELIKKIQRLGVRLSIDDFGTGYSSLSYLQQFPVDKLKIDQTFVRNMISRSGDASIVEAVIALAHALDLTAIAEGVETQEQLDNLRRLGCDEVQGYLFSKPVLAEQIPVLFQRSLGG